MAEWTIATVLKTVVGASLPRVRIPLPPYRTIFFGNGSRGRHGHINNRVWHPLDIMGRCQSGRLGPPAKRLTVLKPFKGSNPFLPAP